MPAVLNAANEIAVRAFLDGRIRLNEIAMLNAAVMQAHAAEKVADLETVLRVDRWARNAAEELIAAKSNSAAIAN